eukprot:scaffold15944_cov248-Ochromonas_danica.AAC.4
MEALAALQSAKRRKSQELEAIHAKANSPKSKRSRHEELRLSVDLGFLPPPNEVFAIGKNQAAAVWWVYENLEGVTGWEVYRYRKDGKGSSDGEDAWQCKGFYSFPLLDLLQVNIAELTNDFEYRFTVKAINAKGGGMESLPSNAVMVEAPLPQGWYRFLDPSSNRFYYASVKTNRSSWYRPELDPYFIDDNLFVNFQSHEIAHLQSLYEEDMAHFRSVPFAQFMDALREVGEKCSSRYIKKLFKAYADNVDKIECWQHYIEIMNHIKRMRLEPHSFWNDIKTFFSRQRTKMILRPNRRKLGVWKLEFSETGESSWEMPDDVKFYIPPSLLNKLLRVFDMNALDDFRQYFSMLDVDNSGDLSDKEITLLLDAMGLDISPQTVHRMVKAIDMNANGTVEFDEFCWMMHELRKQQEKSRPLEDDSLTNGNEDEEELDDNDGEMNNNNKSGKIDLFNSEKWQAMTLSNFKNAVHQLRNRGNSSFLPQPPPGSPTSYRKKSTKLPVTPEMDGSPIVSNQGTVTLKPIPSTMSRWFCFLPAKSSRTVRKKSYVLAIEGDASPQIRRNSISATRRSSIKSGRNMPLLSPSGKEYANSMSVDSFGSGVNTSSSSRKIDPRLDKTLIHGPCCMCGCRAY